MINSGVISNFTACTELNGMIRDPVALSWYNGEHIQMLANAVIHIMKTTHSQLKQNQGGHA